MDELPLIAVMTIRADRYQSLQEAPELLGVHTREFGELKPMPLTEYKDVIARPAERATAAGLRLILDAALVARLLADATGGADSLPLLALDAFAAVSGLRQHRTAHAGQLRGHGRDGAHRARPRSTRCLPRSRRSAPNNSTRCAARSSRGWPPSTGTPMRRHAGSRTGTSYRRIATS